MTVTQANLQEFRSLASEIRAIAVQWQPRLEAFLPPPQHVVGEGRDPWDPTAPYTDAVVHAEIQAITLKAAIDLIVKDLDEFLGGRPVAAPTDPRWDFEKDPRWDPHTRTWRPA
jgi:hypothetical protein